MCTHFISLPWQGRAEAIRQFFLSPSAKQMLQGILLLLSMLWISFALSDAEISELQGALVRSKMLFNISTS